jgi:hypothetical protein
LILHVQELSEQSEDLEVLEPQLHQAVAAAISYLPL